MSSYHVFNVRFPVELWDRVRAAAESDRRSVQQWVLLAVEEKLGSSPVVEDLASPGAVVSESPVASVLARRFGSGVVRDV